MTRRGLLLFLINHPRSTSPSIVVMATSSVCNPHSVGCLYPGGLPLGDKEEDPITKYNWSYEASRVICFGSSK